MLNFVLFAILQGNIFAGGGAGFGTGFTNTSANFAPSVSIHAFPFPIKNIGIFNSLEWDNRYFNLDPFKIDVKDKTFVTGFTFRILKPKFQPSFRVGLMNFSEKIDVTFYDELFVSGNVRKNALFLGTGAYVKLWKKIYLDPEVSIAVSGRPPWRIAARVGWFF